MLSRSPCSKCQDLPRNPGSYRSPTCHGVDGQAHLDLGQDSDDGEADTEGEVEADEDLALVAGAGMCVVDEHQRHGRDGQRVEEEGEEEEAWEAAERWSGGGRHRPGPPGGLPLGPASSLKEQHQCPPAGPA